MLADKAADVESARHALPTSGIDFSLDLAKTKASFLKKLRQNPPDLVIASQSVPGLEGTKALTLAREENSDLPFIFFTGPIEDQNLIETLKRSATDHVFKNRVDELAPAVTRALREEEERARRKAAEEALRESEERYRQLVEHSPCGILVHDEGRVLFMNTTAARLLGAEMPSQIMGRSVIEFIHPDYHQSVNERIRAVEAGQSVPFVEEKWVRLNGAVVDVAVAATPLHFHGDRERHAIQLIALDITGQKKNEAALHRSEERFRLAVESVTDYAIFMLDTEGRVASWNTGAEQMTGYHPQEAIGRSVHELFGAEQLRVGQLALELERAVAEGRIENEDRCLRKDGSDYFMHWVITPVRDAEGRLTGYLKVARDITHRKEYKEQIERWNSELEQRVAERTAQLEAANKELEAFSYSVSHDLRAPLRHIDGFVDILQSQAGQLNEEGRQHLQTIADSARQMGKLIDDLLTFSRMSRVRMNKRMVNLASLVEETVRNAQRGLGDRQVEWVIGDLPQVEGDPNLLRQVLINLIDNALKYTRTRERTRIEMGANVTADEIVFFIRDNGVGFDMRYVDKLFGVFQRLHRTAQFEGTGVGLANVRRIIHRHGGRTWAEGSVNGGATFYFSLPKPKEATI
ncbi:MAG: domain S-box [Pedosphaera sp.]|nr:domain S-box [Pedosphaera sp.]